MTNIADITGKELIHRSVIEIVLQIRLFLFYSEILDMAPLEESTCIYVMPCLCAEMENFGPVVHSNDIITQIVKNFFIFLSHAVVSADKRISFVNNIYTQHYIHTNLIVKKQRLRPAQMHKLATAFAAHNNKEWVKIKAQTKNQISNLENFPCVHYAMDIITCITEHQSIPN